MFDVTLNTECAVSKTLYASYPDYSYEDAREIIHDVLGNSSTTQDGDTIIVRYTAKTLNGALEQAQRVSNALLQDCVAVRVCQDYTDIVLETLCGLNTAPYGEFNSDYFKA